MSYLARVESFVAGIPCLIGVKTYNVTKPWKGSVHTCPSDMDWYGYTELEFDVLDQRGRPAPWLERKLSEKDSERIECDVAEAMKEAA
jgi:hypothetical protein